MVALPSVNTKYTAFDIKMDELLADAKFNCRGDIPAHEILDLARDIRVRGLDTPIAVQPYKDRLNPAINWRVVAGHRREKAYRYNHMTGVPGHTTIPAFIIKDLDEVQARSYNLRENLHRKNLNVLQEATALKYFLDCKGPLGNTLFTDGELAELFGQSRGWVQNRRDLLRLPREIQLAAASGLLTADQIKRLARLTSDTDRFELVRKIKDAKSRGETLDLTPSVQRASDVHKVRDRRGVEIEEMSGLIYDMIGPNIASRFAAWSRGIISTSGLMKSIEEYCLEHGLEYKQPDFLRRAMIGAK